MTRANDLVKSLPETVNQAFAHEGGGFMDNFEYCRPVQYYFGRGMENNTGLYVKALGKKRAMVVYGGGSAVKSGLVDRMKEVLEKEGIETFPLGGIQPNPRADKVYEAIELARKEDIDFILAIGGGSVIDTVKAVALGACVEEDFFDYYFIKKNKATKSLPFGVVLTIPAAGSEGSLSTVIQKEVNGEMRKMGYSTILNLPRFAVLNPELTLTVPLYHTAAGVVDMMCHIMERYFTNTRDVSLTDRLCEGILCSIVETAPRIMAEPDNYEARANIMWAGTLAHNNTCGVGREQDWASHHIEHQLSALYDCAHGAGLAIIFPAWMEYTVNHDVMRFAQFANRVFGITVDFEDPMRTAKKGIDALRAFFRSLGMPLGFDDIKARKDDIPLMLKMLDIDHHSEGHFVVLNREDCEAVFNIAAAYKG